MCPRDAPAQPGDQRANDATAHDRDAVGGRRCRIPDSIERGFHVGGEHSAGRRQTFRDRCDRLGRQCKGALMRVQCKDDVVTQIRRSAFDTTDDGVAIFDRKRERPRHKWRAHALELAFGNMAIEHQPFGAAADGAVEGANPDFARHWATRRLLADFSLLRADVPKRFGLVLRLVRHLLIPCWTWRSLNGYILVWTKKQWGICHGA